MGEPDFSIIIPVYNTPTDLLRRCLDSLITSLIEEAEIIVVDASTNNECQETCKSYPATCYARSDAASVSHQRNIGIELARGTFIGFVDSDDYVSPTFFYDLRSSVLENPDLVVFGHCAFGQFTQSDFGLSVWADDSATIQRWFCATNKNRPKIVHKSVWGKLYKRSIIINNGVAFDESMAIAEDHFFNMRYVRFCSSALAVPRFRLYSYQSSAVSSTLKSTSNSPERFASIAKAWSDFIQEHPDQAWREQEKAYELSLVHVPSMLRLYFCSKAHREKKRIAKRTFVRLLRNDPYHQAICQCRFRDCPNQLKRNELFVLKLGLYGIFFEAYYHKINGRAKP